MTKIEATLPAYFIQEHSTTIRIWHWLTFVIISGLMITVLLTSTLLNQRDNVKVVQEQLKEKGLVVSDDQAFAVTREYEDKIWGIHKLLGYGLAFLVISRILIEVMQPGEEKLAGRIKKTLGLFRLKDAGKNEYKHYLRVKFGYILFYILVFCMAVTGLGLAFGRELGFSRELHGTIKEIHSFGQYLMYGFVLIHICGVIISDITSNKGLVSGMIHGNMGLKK
jgi:Ni/Fe-hydrogenase 1 B-type cytochrome subunit